MPKTTLQPDYSSMEKKKVPKNDEYLKNEGILKSDRKGPYAKAIAFLKLSLWVKN